jgi:hypothetical protein
LSILVGFGAVFFILCFVALKRTTK